MNKGLVIILGAFVLATIASIIFLGYTLTRLDTSITATGESFRSLRLLQTLLISLDDAETSTRDYVISGDTALLSPYNRAVEQLPQTFADIHDSKDVPFTNKEMDALQKDVDDRMRLLAQAVEAKSNGDTELATSLAAGGDGDVIMEDLRRTINGHADKGLSAVRVRQMQSHNRVNRALSVAVALSVFVVGICAVISWYFQRSILRERALENTKSEFLSLASHQLRTPATNVKQYVGLLLDGYLGKITRKQRDALEVAYNNNESEIRIMNDLLDVAKLDLKRIQLRKQRVNVVPIVRQVVKDFEPVAESRGQTIELNTPDEVIAMADRDYLRGVIEKLIDNAVKYSRNKTRISVTVQPKLALECFEIVVRDQGLGIHKREVPKLFMKFSRIANEFSANSEGSGLGLYWVKQVMELHGGEVEVKSQEGKGSEFIIRGPLG